MKQNNPNKNKAVWNEENHKLFIELCLDQLRLGNRPGTYLNKKGWKYVVTEFEKRTGLKYDRKQLKNHWDSTKDKWKAWKYLLNKRADLGWDNEKQTVTASEEFWDTYVKIHKDGKMFKDRGLQHADDLEILFGGVTTKDAFAVTPISCNIPNVIDGPSWTQSNDVDLNLNDVTPDTATPASPVVADANNEIEDVEEIYGGPRWKKLETASGRAEQRQQMSNSAHLCENINRLCELMEEKNKRSDATSFPSEQQFSIPAALKILREIPGLTHKSPVYLFGITFLLKEEHRIAFVALEDDDVRLAWLTQEHEKSTHHPG